MKMPEHGLSREQILERLREYRAGDPDWSEGKIFGYVFHADEDVSDTVEEAFRLYMWDNALDPSVFQSLLRLETEVVEMCAKHLHGDDEVVGNFTSGGTESCMLAVKAARDWARANRPEVTEPEMILPVTAHPAFHKGAHYLDVKAVTVPVNSETLTVDPDTVRDAITDNTIMIVGSASNFAFGTVDPMTELAEIAGDRIWVHSDGCIGGFLLELFEELGQDVTPFDFRVPGVNSISMDLHKYAFAAKGASVIMFRNKELRKYQIFAHSGWTGYTIINPTIQSTKSGGPLAGAWAVLHYLGHDGYLEYARRIREATDRFLEGIEAIDGLYVMGKPEMSLVAVASNEINIFELCDEMKERGWHLGPQPGAMGIPETFHITMLPFNTDKIDAVLKDLAECVDIVRDRETPPIVAQLAAMAQTLDPATIDDAMIERLLGMVGIGGGGGAPPERMAEINAILNVLPPKLADRLLTAFYNDWNRYRDEQQ